MCRTSSTQRHWRRSSPHSSLEDLDGRRSTLSPRGNVSRVQAPDRNPTIPPRFPCTQATSVAAIQAATAHYVA
eukprot:3364315-Prymnesium_polylepis.1